MESVTLPTRAFVNGSYLQKFINQPVTFIGSVLKVIIVFIYRIFMNYVFVSNFFTGWFR